MSASPTTNNLYAVLLSIRSKSGAKIVYSFPDAATQCSDTTTPDAAQANGAQHNPLIRTISRLSINRYDQTAAESTAQPPAETICNVKTEVLEKILNPGRWSDAKPFEITIDNLTFISQPCHAHENGSWTDPHAADIQVERPHSVKIREPTSRAAQLRDFTHISNSFDSHLSGQSLATSMDSASTRSNSIVDGLLMFHVVFVLQEMPHARALDTAKIYECICQPLIKTLRHLQEQHRYVELECRKILTAKTKSRPSPGSTALEEPVFQDSELAWALKELYTAISTEGIAIFRFNGMEMALQMDDTKAVVPLQLKDLNMALLLLEDKSQLTRSLDVRPGATVMSHFIKDLVSTKPLSKMALRLALPPSAVLFLAEHLIRWRKARLISPLHARNTYVVNPNADLDNLTNLSTEYGKRFPALPSLYKMLSILGSGKPIVYGSCFPSRSHRDTYMDILAWLVRKHLVIQLKTSGWLQIKLNNNGVDDTAIIDDDEDEDASSIISDSGTAFRPDSRDAQQLPQTTRITEPTSMTREQRRAVIAIRHSLSDVEMQEVFSRLIKYCDGEHDFEDVAVIEGFKRSKVDECLSKLNAVDALQTFQHP